MASTPFKVVSWSPLEPITDEKLDAMVSNDNWLRDNSVRGRYSSHGIERTEGIRIAAGLVLIPAGRRGYRRRYVNLGDFFSQGCRPIVTTGVISTSQRKIFATVDGPGSKPHPQREGFQVHVAAESRSKKRRIKRNFYVAWHALGF